MSITSNYTGNVEVQFLRNDQQALTVTVYTERLYLTSVTKEHSGNYASLFGDLKVMEKFATGQIKKPEEIEARIENLWVKRWHQNDPYSALAAFENDTDDFVGHVVLGHGGTPGQSELAYLFMQKHWGKRVGTEAVTAVLTKYAPATVDKGYTLDGKPLETITATTRPDNEASVKILEKLGMKKIGQDEKFGALRNHYSISLSEITKV